MHIIASETDERGPSREGEENAWIYTIVLFLARDRDFGRHEYSWCFCEK